MFQPGSTASDSATGNSPAMMMPRYGTKRSSTTSSAHNMAFGTPMTLRPR